jgi:DNA polymerase-3 subunit beta
MSVSVSRDQLFELVQKAYAVAPQKSSLQILMNLMISCSGPGIEVSATDLDQSIVCSGRVSGKGSFKVAVNSRKLFDIVREMPPGEVSIEEDENVLSIASEKGFSCKVAGADVADFPGFPEVADTVDFSMSARDFRRLTERSAFAVARDTTRSCLCGVLMEADGDGVRMIGTDGHRLGSSLCRFSTGIRSRVAAIASPKSLQHVARITETDTEDQTLSISAGEKYLVIAGRDFRLCSKLLDGPYPDYAKVIPKANPKNVLLERTALIDAVRRVSVLSNQKTHLIKLKFEEGTLEAAVVNREIGGEAREVVPITYKGDVHSIGFNAQYLSEILTIAGGQKVKLEMNTQISACLVLPLDDKSGEVLPDDLFLIMPLRLMEEG